MRRIAFNLFLTQDDWADEKTIEAAARALYRDNKAADRMVFDYEPHLGGVRLRFGLADIGEDQTAATLALQAEPAGLVLQNNAMRYRFESELNALGIRYLIYDPAKTTDEGLAGWLNEPAAGPASEELRDADLLVKQIEPAVRSDADAPRDADLLVARIETAILEAMATGGLGQSLAGMGDLIARVAARGPERERLRERLRAKNTPEIRNILLGLLHDAGRDLDARMKPPRAALDGRVYALKAASVSVAAGSILLVVTAVSWPVVILGVFAGAVGFVVGRNEESTAQAAIDTIERQRKDAEELRRILLELPG